MVVTVRLGVGMSLRLAMRATRTTGLGAGSESFVDDGLDGAGATAAFGAAAQATVDLLGITRQIFRGADGAADIVVGNDIAGTNDHETAGPIALFRSPSIGKTALGCKRKKPSFKQFQTAILFGISLKTPVAQA